MSKTIRSWIFYIFIFLFIVGTIVISLYASGYKLNLSWPPQNSRLLVKTGMIIVESRPSGASVFLDDKPQAVFSVNPWKNQSITTDAKLRNIPPGEYLVRLERAGYWSWEKRVRVYPNQATTLSEVNLFRRSEPEKLKDAPRGELSLSPDNRQLYIDSRKEILSLKSRQTLALGSAPEKNGRWLNNASNLLIDSQLFSTDGLKADYRALIGTSTSSLLDEETNRLYYEKNGALAFLDANTQAATILTSDQAILSFAPRRQAIYLIAVQNGQTFLKKFPLPAGPAVEISPLPNIGKYQFADSRGQFLSLYDSQNQTLYLIDEEAQSASPTVIKGVRSWKWADDNTLVYNNDWEIYRYDLNSSQAHLLTRVGEEIQQLIWNAQKNYLLFTTKNSLQVYDPRLETTTKLLQTDDLASPVLNADDDLIYFWAKIGQQEGVYEYRLQ